MERKGRRELEVEKEIRAERKGIRGGGGRGERRRTERRRREETEKDIKRRGEK